MTKLPAPLWDIKGCAQYLNLSERTVQRAIKLAPDAPGSIPFLRVGRRTVRFDGQEIAAWLQAGSPPVSIFRARKMTEPDK